LVPKKGGASYARSPRGPDAGEKNFFSPEGAGSGNSSTHFIALLAEEKGRKTRRSPGTVFLIGGEGIGRPKTRALPKSSKKGRRPRCLGKGEKEKGRKPVLGANRKEKRRAPLQKESAARPSSFCEKRQGAKKQVGGGGMKKKKKKRGRTALGKRGNSAKGWGGSISLSSGEGKKNCRFA